MTEREKNRRGAPLEEPEAAGAALDRALVRGERQTARTQQLSRSLQSMTEDDRTAQILAQAIRRLLREE